MAHNPERLSRLRAVMGEQGIDALYVRELSNISWATGFERVFDDEPAHALVVSARNCVLHTDSRYFDAMKSAAADTDIEVDNSRMAHSAVLAKVSDCIDGDIVRVGIEDSMPLAEFAPCSERLRAGQSIWWNSRAL
jgi:Xaa-Pro aminopeptidase